MSKPVCGVAGLILLVILSHAHLFAQQATKEAICRRSAYAMQVDGDLTDWRDVDAREAMVIGEAAHVQKPQRYKGPLDASALVYTKWDDKNFYLAAVVSDDLMRNTQVETTLQEGDGLLVCLAPSPPTDSPPARYPYGFIVTPGDGEAVKPQFMVITDANRNPLIPPGPWLTEVRKAVQRTSGGYILELSIPLSVMPQLKPAAGRVIGCEVCLYESDTRVGPTKRTTIVAWCSVKDRMNPAEGGKLVFAEANKQKPAQSPGSLRASDLIQNPYKPPADERVVRKPHEPFAAAGLPIGLYFARNDREAILRKLKNDTARRLFDRLTATCESYQTTWQPERYSFKDLLPSDAELASKVILRLAFLYALTEEDEHADLAGRTMRRVCEQASDWSSRLDSPERLRVAAQLLRGLAIGSDWIHNFLTPDERALVEKTLAEASTRLMTGASAAKLSPSDRAVALASVALPSAMKRQRDGRDREWLLAAELAAVEYAKSGWDAAPDAALFAIVSLADPLKKTLGHDLFSSVDLRAVIAKRADMLKMKVPSGWAIDLVSARYASQVHACVLARAAALRQDGHAAWLYKSIFSDLPASSRDAEDVFTFLWLDESVKASPPAWFKEQSQAELAAKLDGVVKDACVADAAAREKARTNQRSTVKAQRALPVPFSAEWLKTVDEKVLADFQVTVKPELLKRHPRLFFTEADRPVLYARIASCQAKMWPSFVEVGERNLRTQYRTMASFREQGSLGAGTGDTLALFAFVASLTHDDAHGETLKRLVQGYCAEEIWDPPRPDLVHAHVLTGLALSYDVGQRWLMPEERQMVRDKLITEARRMYGATCRKGRERTQGNANNHSWIQKCGLAIAAMAVYEHTPDAKLWLDRVRWEYQKILELHGSDGASCEGASYWAYGLQWMLKFTELLWRASGENMYEHPWLRQTGYYSLYCMAPNRAAQVNFGDNGEPLGRASQIPYRLASEFRDEHIQWLGDHLEWSEKLRGRPGANMWAFLWHDPTVAPKPPDTLPPYRYFNDLEMVIVKSSWKEDARMLAFRCGPPMGHSVFAHGAGGYGHAQQDQNHFICFAGGSRFIVSDPGYSRWKMTAEHNLVLVDGLGQIGEEQHWFHTELKPDELAEMQEVFLSPGYCYMRGEAHRAYRKETGLQEFTRQVLFLDGEYLVVFDELAADAPRKFEWLLHSWNAIEGPTGNVFTSSQDDARLATALLLPEPFEHTMKPMLVKSAVKWGADGKPIYVQDPVQHGHYLSVWPREKSPTARFLAVLWPYAKDAEPPRVGKLVRKDFVAATVDAGKQRDTVIFNLTDSHFAEDGLATDGRCAMIRTDSASQPSAYVLHRGTTLASGNRELVKASAPIILHLDTAKGEGALEAKSAVDLELHVPRAVKALTANGAALAFRHDAESKLLKFSAKQGKITMKLE